MDAKAAVNAAEQWDLFTEERLVAGENGYAGNGKELSDNEGNMFESIIQITRDDTKADDFVIESTVIRLVTEPKETAALTSKGRSFNNNLKDHNHQLIHFTEENFRKLED